MRRSGEIRYGNQKTADRNTVVRVYTRERLHPFEDRSFDIVLSLNGFHAFPDKDAAYRETYRVLKKGGTFCGCFYVRGEMKKTDRFTDRVFVPKGAFTPPFETKESLRKRLESMYEEVRVKTVLAEGIFRCRK